MGVLYCVIDEYREYFRQGAARLPDWESLSKNELCFKYVDNEGNRDIQNACFSALVYKYWPLINKYWFQCSNVASQEDVYDWLVDSINYALEHRRWLDPDSNIYNDPTGPDKVINRRMKCARLTFYQFINRKKRKDNFGMLSLDELLNVSDTPEATLPNSVSSLGDDRGHLNTDPLTSIDLHNYVKSLFKRKDYFLAFMVDIIMREDVFDFNDGVSKFNPRKLAKRLRHITPEYCEYFALEYELDEDVYSRYTSYCKNLSSNLIYNKIEYNLLKLRHDKFFSLSEQN